MTRGQSDDRGLKDSVMYWLAIHFGKRMEWNGPTVFGVGYLWCGQIYWALNETPGVNHD